MLLHQQSANIMYAFSVQNLLSKFMVFLFRKEAGTLGISTFLQSHFTWYDVFALEHLSSITDVAGNGRFSVTKFQSAICICHGVHRLQFHFNRRETTYFTCKRIPSSAPRERAMICHYCYSHKKQREKISQEIRSSKCMPLDMILKWIFKIEMTLYTDSVY